MVHPYFTAKAREAFRSAAGDPDNAGPLAAWAESVRDRENPPQGVCVAEDGRVLAETVYVGRGERVAATYVNVALDPIADDVVNREVRLACGALSRAAGATVIHVKFSEVCQGSAR